jgi:fido (protein-threonine AMPylation protein)
MLTAKNAKDWFSEREGADPIAEWVDAANKRSSLEAGDIILSTRGTVGMCALVTDEVLPANIDQDVARISWRDKKTFIPGFVVAYLNSTYGQDHIARFASGMVQQGLSLQKVREIPIPALSSTIQADIASVVDAALNLRRQSIIDTTAAEQTLLRALGLENWQPPEPLTYTRSSRDAFIAGRLDAEYFYPAKQAALDMLSVLPGRTVGEMFHSVRELWQPEAAPANQKVRNYDLTDALTPFLDSSTAPVYPAGIASTKKRIETGDLLVSRLRSYLREIAVVMDCDDVPMVASTEFIVLRPRADAMRVEALLVYLRSTLPQLIFKWSQDGSNHPRFDEKELLNLRVPDIVLAEQDHLAEMLQSSIHARRRAVELLDAAKRAVEIAIEDSEAAALAWLEQAAALAEPPISCDHGSQEPHHDQPATAKPRPTPEDLARRPSGRGQPAGGLSRPGAGVHPEFHGPGERARGAPGGGSPADSTRPLDATRELATAAGPLTYTQVSERLAAQVADCLDELLDAEPEDIAITPDWLRELHRRIAGELFPDWAGRFRTTDVQVGTHFPPPAHALAVHVRDFCLDLEERLRHLAGAESISDLLAWVDWRFQWIHPFKDFNGRVGRILLVALAYKLGLPPPDPADVANKADYFAALRAADAGDPGHLRDIWLARLAR